MSEKKYECKCNTNSKELPVVMGGIVVYELAIIIFLLVLIYFDLDVPCEKPHSLITTGPEEVRP